MIFYIFLAMNCYFGTIFPRAKSFGPHFLTFSQVNTQLNALFF